MSLGRRSPLSRLRVYAAQQDMVKPKRLKYRKTPKMDLYKRRVPDYSEIAYREAVAKLKYLLAESYTPVSVQRTRTLPLTTGASYSAAEKEWSDSAAYPLETSTFRPSSEDVPPYLRRQEDYIEHLEKEGQLYREELSRVLDKVKEVVTNPSKEESEEDDSEKEAKGPVRTHRGPSIVYSSRISELEAQLTQCRLELRKVQDEASYLKAHSKPIQPPVSQQSIIQMEQLQRERDELNERVSSLQGIVGQLRDKEASASQKAKRSLEVVDQAQFDKNQLETEVRRLRSELERMNDKQREALQESARRVSEAERRYALQMERLNGDLAAQWDAANRLNLELDRARRTEAELRRDLAQKVANMEELKKELMTKTGTLQTEALTAGAERESLEAELTASRIAIERSERQGRQEVARLQAEVQALRSRLDRADQDLLYSRKENIRLSDVIAGLEKELSLAKLTKDSTTSKDSKRADELASMIKDMDTKHAESVSQLEGLIHSQTELMEKLNGECQGLTRKLEESSSKHKQEMAKLQNNVNFLSSKLDAPLWRDDEKLGNYKDETHSNEKKNGKENGGPFEIENTRINPDDRVEIEQNNHKQDLNKPKFQPDVENRPFENRKNILYQQEELSKEQQEPYQENNRGKYEESAYDDSGKGEYKQRETDEYNQGQDYNQTVAGYDQEQYEKKQVDDYPQEQVYDPSTAEPYQQDQTYNEAYNQSGAKEYEQQAYEAGDPAYEQGQHYQQQGEEGYDQNQMYDQSNVEYSHDQGYDPSADGYAQGQVFDQTGVERYEDNQGFDQTEQEHYEDNRGYDQMQQGYDQGQTYDNSGQVYPQEQSYDPNVTEQAYDPNVTEQTYDPNTTEQAYDPNATEQAYDPNATEQAYDPNTTEQAYDQNATEQAYDPNATEQAYDQNTTKQAAYIEGENHAKEGYVYDDKK